MLVAAVSLGLLFVTAPVEPVKKVLVLGLDGCRPDAMMKAQTPHIDSLIAKGAYAVGRANLLTVSGPCWSSIMCGVWSDKHGVIDNGFGGSNFKEYPDFLTVVEWMRPRLRTVSITAWTPVSEQIVQVADYEGPKTGKGDEVTALEVANELRENNPDVIMVHLDEPDHAGHAYTYDPDVPEYIKGIEDTDANIGVILGALEGRATYAEEDWLIILTSDHGGVGYGHGGQTPQHVNIPFVVSGPSAAKEFAVVPTQIDVAPTVFAHLGLSPGGLVDWDGIPVGLKGVDSKALSELRDRMLVRLYPDNGFGVGELEVALAVNDDKAIARYTTDGSMPTANSPQVLDVLKFREDTTIRARAFLDGKPVGPSRKSSFRVQKEYNPASDVKATSQGLAYQRIEAITNSIADLDDIFIRTANELIEGVSATVTHKAAGMEENYVLDFTGFVEVPDDAIYQFVLHSDDGSRLWIDGQLLINHDGQHGASSKSELVALRAGKHAIRVGYFQADGGQVLRLAMGLQGEDAKELTVSQLSHSG